MEFLIIVFLIILLIVILGINSHVNGLTTKVDFLQKQAKHYHELNNQKFDLLTSKEDFKKESIKKEEIKPAVVQEIIKPIEIVEEEKIAPVIQEEIKKPIFQTDSTSQNSIHLSDQIKNKIVESKPTPKEKMEAIKEPKLSFFDKNPDLEKFIGENLMNKIGIGILVLGIGFFVKYAISQGWISEEVRTAIGIFCGGILIGVAHKLRKTFAAFSSVLVGGGLAVLYFTITIAFHEYHIFSQTVAFVIMIFITAFAVLLSVSYDRKELAILAIIGGFTSPFMLSTGEGNYIIFFTYVTILNIGMLVLAYFKKWNIVTVISYLFTVVLFAGWLFTKAFYVSNAPYFGALVFATIFYLIFFLMNIINNVKEKRIFNTLEISLLLSNTLLYFAAGLGILSNIEHGYFNGLFTLFVAIFNFFFAFVLYKKESVDKNLVYLLIGFVLTFLSLAAPIQLEGNQITLFWAAESVLLLWLSQKSGIKLMKKVSIIILCLMIVSLIMDWDQTYFTNNSKETLSLILNKGFITSLFAVSCIYLTILFLNKEEDDFLFESFEVKYYQEILSVIICLFIYIGLLLELRYQLNHFIEYYATKDIIIGSYNLLFLVCLSIYSGKKAIPVFLETTVVLSLIGILSYPLFYNFMAINVRNSFIHGHGYFSSYLFHYVDVILVLLLLFSTYKNMQIKSFILKDLNKGIVWFVSLIVIYIASAELDHIMALSSYSSKETIRYVLNQNHKIGFPILWGISSFILMILGMRAKSRDLRIISLFLFLIIIVKLFIFDIRGISEGGKIAAFIFLGIILLIVSFMYQKLKTLILDNNPVPKPETKSAEE